MAARATAHDPATIIQRAPTLPMSRGVRGITKKLTVTIGPMSPVPHPAGCSP